MTISHVYDTYAKTMQGKILHFDVVIDQLDQQKALRIPVQSCHLFQTNAATHSISKLPLIPVNVATL